MKKTVLVLIALVLCIPVITYAADGKPFQQLQDQINNLTTQLLSLTTQVEQLKQRPSVVYGHLDWDGGVTDGPNWSLVYPTGTPDVNNPVGVYDIHLFTLTDPTITPTCLVQYPASLSSVYVNYRRLDVEIGWINADSSWHLQVWNQLESWPVPYTIVGFQVTWETRDWPIDFICVQ